LKSECINGKRATVVIWAVGPSIGIGAGYKKTINPPLSPSGTPAASFVDKLDYIDPSIFNGIYSNYTANATVNPYTYGASITVLGKARNPDLFGPGYAVGIGAGYLYTFGSSTVKSTKWEKCDCNK